MERFRIEQKESLGFFFLKKEGTWGSTFIGFKGREPRVSLTCSSLVNVKYKSGNLIRERSKNKGLKWSVI